MKKLILATYFAVVIMRMAQVEILTDRFKGCTIAKMEIGLFKLALR